MTDPRPTESLRAEHRQLLPNLIAMEDASRDLGRWERDVVRSILDDIVTFLRNHLLVHAAAEEAVLYPAIEVAMGAPGATATMTADHAEISSRVDRLASTVTAVDAAWPDRDLAGDLSRQLAALAALVHLHFRKEEDVLLAALDEAVSSAAVEELAARMHDHATGQHAHEGPASSAAAAGCGAADR